MSGFKMGRILAAPLALWIGLSLLGCQAPAAPAATQAPAAKPTQAAAGSTTPAAAVATPAAATTVTQPTAAAPAATQPAASAAQSIRVGFSLGYTGAGARNSMNGDRFMRMAIDQVNAKGINVGGKVYRLDVVATGDDKQTSEGGVDVGNRLVLAEKVKVIMGTTSSPLATEQPISEPNKVLQMAFTGNEPSYSAKFPLTFAQLPPTRMRQGTVYDWFVQQYPNAKRIATVMADDPTNRQVFGLAQERIKEKGLTLVAQEFFPTDIKDSNPLITRVLREKPDAIDFGGIGGKGSVLLGMTKALQEQGFKGPMISTSADTAVMRDGAANMEGFVTAQLGDWRSAGTGEKAVFEQYIKKYPEADMETIVVSNYNNPLLVAQAMEKAGTVDDMEKVAATLRAGEWDTIWSADMGKTHFVGAKTYGQAVIPEQPIYLTQVQQGKLVTLKATKGTIP